MDIEWWKDKISEDIYETLRTKEQHLPPYHGHSPQQWFRRHLVDWLAIVVETFYLGTTSQHLAVHLLDFFMDKLEVDQNHLYLLAMACLSISVKYEEHCDKTLKLNSLNHMLPSHSLLSVGYSAAELTNMEITVLNFFDWSLSIPTVAQFVPYFLVVSVDNHDLIDGQPILCKSAVVTCLEKHTKYFMEISLQDHVFRNYTPSLIAASCIAASRISLRLTPTWPQHLQLMTDYFIEELLPCVNIMLRIIPGVYLFATATTGPGYLQRLLAIWKVDNGDLHTAVEQISITPVVLQLTKRIQPRFQKKDLHLSQCSPLPAHYPPVTPHHQYQSPIYNTQCYPPNFVTPQHMMAQGGKPQLFGCRGS